MSRLGLILAFVLAGLGACASASLGQAVTPRIGYVYPAGGQQGTTFEVLLGGQYLEGVDEARLSGSGIKAEVLEHIKPLSVRDANVLKDQLAQLQQKKTAAWSPGFSTTKPSTRPVWSSEDQKLLEEIREKLSKFIPKSQVNPALVENVRVRLTIAKEAEPGDRSLRLRTPQGLTNALTFCVGQLPEVSRPPAEVFREPRNGLGVPPAISRWETVVTLPAMLNGQIMPGGAHRFRFKATRGQRLVAVASARALIPYLADAVPGWFQATLTLYDAKGKEVAFDDDYRFNPDPVLCYVVPADGDYTLEIRDALYRGREDFVYRIALGELPFVTSVFPLGGHAGQTATIDVSGWNLASTQLTRKPESPGLLQLTMNRGRLLSNRAPFAVDDLPECLEREPNDHPEQAQPLTLPIIVNGRIGKPGDWDVYRIDGRAGMKLAAEVFARRLNSPLDSLLRLTDASGKEIAANDDYTDKGDGLTTHHADSYLLTALPSTGIYYLYIGDTQGKGGPEYGYRLRVSAARPDYALRVVPSSINVRRGASAKLTVFALRKDGFSGDIDLILKDAPAGFKLSGAKVPAGQDQVQLTLFAPSSGADQPLTPRIEGRAAIGGQSVLREAVPADDMMQAFAYHQLVPARELLVDVLGRWANRAPVTLLDPMPLKLPLGGAVSVRVASPTKTLFGDVELELSDAPPGITIDTVAPIAEGTRITFRTDAAKIKPGQKGNLVVLAFTNVTVPAEKGGGKRRVSMGALPAMPFEVVAK